MNALISQCIGLLICTVSIAGEPPRNPPAPNDFAPKPPPQNFAADGPWNRDVIAYRVSASGAVEKAATFERAGVPTIARLKDGRLIVAHQHFPESDRENFDKVAVHFSSDDGKTWSAAQVIQVEGLPEGMRFPFDPTLVPLPDGRVRLYFTGNMGRTFQRSTPAIHSAISADGVNYNYEPGVRFNVEGRMIIDCAVALHAGVFHLFAPDNGAGENPGQRRADEPAADRPREGIGYHATSADGLNFSRVADLQIEGRRRWLGNAQSDGKLITFYGTGEGMSNDGDRPRGAFWMATSADGQNWNLVANPPIGGGDPGAVATRDGGLLVVITGESRVRNLGGRPAMQPPGMPTPGQIHVERIDSKYKAAPGAKPGAFTTGQDADLMLGGFGFNNSGGALHFNHPTGLATDGRALLMTDRWNNRVLVWKSAPDKNTPPDLVLGQADFTQNDSGTGRHQMNWPGNVAITPDGTRVAVTDTNNDRILIWNSFPTTSGQAADLVLDLEQLSRGNEQQPRPEPGAVRPRFGGGMRFGWPWGVWTDGKKLAVVATHGSAVLVWNSFPTRDSQPPDLVLRPEDAGTPRNVTSDGNWFAVSDHNNGEDSRPATMVWRTFPTSSTQPPDFRWREWLKGSFTADGRLVMGGMSKVFLWNKPPQDTQTDADVVLRPATYRNGDGPDAVVANGRLYVCTYNGNHILGWNALPARDDQPADFSIGSDTPEQDTWAENFFIQNAVVATDGRSLFVTSDFDRKMFIWRSLPDESAAKPDLVMHLPDGPWDNELHGSTLALAGRSSVSIWKKLPLNGEPPDVVLSRRIGSVELGELTGVAFDDKYFYLSDRRSETIHVWEGIPGQDSEPKFTLAMRSPGRLSSDGNYLCAAPFEGGSIQLWRVSELGARAEPITLGGRGQFNLPSECLIADGRLFVCNRSFNRVDVWNRVEDALGGRPADAFLGAADAQDRKPGIGRNKLFMPGSLAWGNGYLWVGEFKFSTRILRFSPKETGARPAGARQPMQPAAVLASAQTPAGSPRSAGAASARSDTVTDWGAHWSQGRAIGKGPVRFTHSPMRLEDIKSIVPYGMMVGGHVCPIDHGYFFPKQLEPGQPHFDVMVPADGFIVMVGHRTQLTGSSERGREYDDYALTIEHSGTFYTQYDLLTSLDKSVLDQLDASVRERFARKQMGPSVQTRIAVKAGQVIGKVGGRSLDFGVVNTEVKLAGFLTPQLYGHYAWRMHIVDPFDFFDEPLKSKLLALNVRKVKPFFGRIDYDVDGRLIGNWFVEGSGGYPGNPRDPRGYWMGHLAFAPHHIDSAKIVVSIGDFGGKPAQYWVKGNAPDPAKVGEKDGVVKYELIRGQLGSSGDRQVRQDADEVQGTVLAQVMPGRKLKFEAFPNQTAAQNTGFTANARVYER